MVNLKSGQLWGWLDDVDKRQFLGGSGWCRKSWIDGVGSLGNIRWYSITRWYQMHLRFGEDTEIPDFRRWIHAQGQKAQLDALQKAEDLLASACRKLQDRMSWAWPSRNWCGFPGCQEVLTFYDILHHIYIYIYILNHIMTAASIQFYSRFVETFRNGDRDRFLRSKATWRRCHLGILPASSELWRRSKKARLGNWTPTLKADLVPQKCWSHLLSIKLDGFVSKIVFNSCFCLVTFLNCFLWESWPRCFFVSIFFEHRIQDDIPPSFSYCIDVILFITLSDYRYIHHNSIR